MTNRHKNNIPKVVIIGVDPAGLTAGYERTSLSAQKDNPAVRFYERPGCEITGKRPDHANHEDFLMMKKMK